MSVKSIVLLLLLSMTVNQVTVRGGHHMCNPHIRPMSCINDTRIKVDKSKRMYRLTILCASNQCTENITINFECRDICEACEILAGRDCGDREDKCEGRMDDILNQYCLSTISATTTQAFKSTTPMTFFRPASFENGSGASASERDDDANSITLGPFIALGVLFCISVLLLATVTVGWACTCRYIMTKRDPKRSTVELKGKAKYSIGTNEEDLKNPSYEINGRVSSTGAPAVVAYDVVANTPSQARKPGQKYNVLNRGQATGQTGATAAQSTGADRGYSQLGPHDGEHTNKYNIRS